MARARVNGIEVCYERHAEIASYSRHFDLLQRQCAVERSARAVR